MTIIYFVPVALVMSFGIWACRSYDHLVSAEYQRYRDEWERNGKPWGVFWRPPGKAWSERRAFTFRGWTRQFGMLFRTPAWMAQDEEMKRLLSRYRWMLFLWVFVAMPLLGLSEMLLVYLFGTCKRC